MPFNPAFDDDSDPQNWFASNVSATTPWTPPAAELPTPPVSGFNPPAPPPGSWWGWPDSWQSLWSMFPASAAGAEAWQPPVFPNDGSPIGSGPASIWPTTSTLPSISPSSDPRADPAPSWPPSQSLLGLIPYLGLTDSDPGTKGFFSLPVLGGRLPPDSFVQSVSNSNTAAAPPAVDPSGNPAGYADSSTASDESASDTSKDSLEPPISKSNLLSRFFNAINPISPAQAAEGEGAPMSPAMARALANALHDSAAAAELLKSQDALATYHQAMQDALAYAGNVPSSRVLGKLLELSGFERPAGYEAHHIAAGKHERAEPARQVLEKLGININDPMNGVFLPATENTVNVNGEAVHRSLHTYEYIDAVNKALTRAKTKPQAIDILRSIGRALQAGGYP